jgi:hypothetical protein
MSGIPGYPIEVSVISLKQMPKMSEVFHHGELNIIILQSLKEKENTI